MVTITASYEGMTGEPRVVKPATEMQVTEPTTVTLTLPAAFADALVFITHKDDCFAVKADASAVISFTVNSFSPFTFSTEKPEGMNAYIDFTNSNGVIDIRYFASLYDAAKYMYEIGYGKMGAAIFLEEGASAVAEFDFPVAFILYAPDAQITAASGFAVETTNLGEGILYEITRAAATVEFPDFADVYYDFAIAMPINSIRIASTANGTVTTRAAVAHATKNVLLTVAADEGYQLESLTITDLYGRKVTVTERADGKYSFRMPNTNATVTAVFQEIPAAEEAPADAAVETPADAAAE